MVTKNDLIINLVVVVVVVVVVSFFFLNHVEFLSIATCFTSYTII